MSKKTKAPRVPVSSLPVGTRFMAVANEAAWKCFHLKRNKAGRLVLERNNEVTVITSNLTATPTDSRLLERLARLRAAKKAGR